MQLERIETPGLAHLAYLIASGREAILVDPCRDVDRYLRLLQGRGLRLRYVVETHKQEDFVMGSAALAQVTGAAIVNGKHPAFGHGDVRLEDGERLALGELSLLALHVPGHTPESMAYAIFVEDVPDHALAVLTGDALFVGDTGRTDLDTSAPAADHAAHLYDAIHAKLVPLGDQALVLPAHGAGSICGRGMADRPLSSLGLERAYNPVFRMSREAFVAAKAGETIPRPPYFRHMEEVNLVGGMPLRQPIEAIPSLSAPDFAKACEGAVVIDARGPEAFAGGHVPDAYSLWPGGLSAFGGWIVDAHTSVCLVLDPGQDRGEALRALMRIGVDDIRGVLAGGFASWRDAGLPVVTTGTTTPRALAADLASYHVLDVREPEEVAGGHIPEAENLFVGDLVRGAEPSVASRDTPIAITCSVGNRTSLAISELSRRGHTRLYNLLGGMTAWQALGLRMV